MLAGRRGARSDEGGGSPLAEPASTPALEALAALGVDHEVVRTGPVDSLAAAARARGVPVAAVVKTLVVRVRESQYAFVLVPGDRVIDWAKLRAHLGVRRLSLPDAAEALAATGYERGAITPLGAITAWPVVADDAIMSPGVVSLGGGAHGVSVTIAPKELVRILGAAVADVTKPA